MRYRYDDPASPLQWDDRGADRIYGIDPYDRRIYRHGNRRAAHLNGGSDQGSIAGAYIGGGIGFLMIATVSPMKAIVFVIFLVILQQLEGQFIYPRVVGASIGLPGIWVLAAVTIGGSVLGIGGMLLFVPLTATVYKLLRNDVKKRNAGKKGKGQ